MLTFMLLRSPFVSWPAGLRTFACGLSPGAEYFLTSFEKLRLIATLYDYFSPYSMSHITIFLLYDENFFNEWYLHKMKKKVLKILFLLNSVLVCKVPKHCNLWTSCFLSLWTSCFLSTFYFFHAQHAFSVRYFFFFSVDNSFDGKFLRKVEHHKHQWCCLRNPIFSKVIKKLSQNIIPLNTGDRSKEVFFFLTSIHLFPALSFLPSSRCS